MIQIKNLRFSYREHVSILKGLNLSLHYGNVYGLLGENGTGKSTLLRLIAGLLKPTEGSCLVEGQMPSKRNPSVLSEIYFLPEEFDTPDFSMEEYARVYGVFYPRFSIEELRTMMLEFQLNMQTKLSSMSLGQKKKALIAFALATNTRILLLDEPINGLDIPSKSQFRKVIVSIATDDRVIVISTHQVRELDRLLDPIIILGNQELVLHATVEDISKQFTFTSMKSVANVPEVVYSEPSLRGFSVIKTNQLQMDGVVDLELLFKASLINQALFKSLLTNDITF